jgi:hypothetical protein
VEEHDRRYLTLLLEEYKTLESAGSQAGQNIYLSLQWGSAFMAVLVAAAASQWHKHDAAVALVFFLAVPFLSSMAMLFTIGELARVRRIADYLCVTEIKAKLLASYQVGTDADFHDRFNSEIDRIEETLGIRMPVPVTADPLGWERWLVELRKQRAGATFGHLAWVYRLRLGLYPVAAYSSLAIATYYTFTSRTTQYHATSSYAMLAVGFGFATVALILGVELATELARVTAYPDTSPGFPRRLFRRLAGFALDIGDWKAPPKKLDQAGTSTEADRLAAPDH